MRESMHKSLAFSVFLIAAVVLQSGVHAYFNETFLTTTVTLSNSTSAHVIETVNLYVSNSSVAQYNQDRQAVNLTLSGWQQALGSGLLVQHILNPKSSISNFTLLPGPLVLNGNGGNAALSLSYYAKNVTNVANVAPRQFEYAFNSTVFNFMHTASGPALFPQSRLVIILPNGASLSTVYPAPDLPLANATGGYGNDTVFTWDSGEPLQKFSFVFMITETPQQEVIKYFSYVYGNYAMLVWAAAAIILAAILVYIYLKVLR
jgi:hypothetical protein